MKLETYHYVAIGVLAVLIGIAGYLLLKGETKAEETGGTGGSGGSGGQRLKLTGSVDQLKDLIQEMVDKREKLYEIIFRRKDRDPQTIMQLAETAGDELRDATENIRLFLQDVLSKQ